MLIQSHEKRDGIPVLRLLPALPDDWPTGRISGVRARGGFELAFSWDQKQVRETTVFSKNGGRCLLLINGQEHQITLSPNQTLVFRVPEAA